MIEVVGVSFKDKGRIYYFLPNKLNIHKNINVVVETGKGMQFGKVETETIKLPEHKIVSPLKKIVRIASNKDFEQHKNNIRDAEKALQRCKKMIEDKKMDMQIINASYTFDRDQLIFQFIADKRVDFRDFVKELASIYKTRIEMRQVGVRDKAREVGGLGHCGRTFCCAKFLNDFDTVSINMAKNQNLALNPNKINGVCGRLLCCLNYEDNHYKECRKNMPKMGSRVKTASGEGKVVSLDILKQTYRVDIPEIGIVENSVDGSN